MLGAATALDAQEKLAYQQPSQAILELADYQRPPMSYYIKRLEAMVYLYRPTYSSLEDLRIEELRLGGLRIDPKYLISSTTNYIDKLEVQDATGRLRKVEGLPKNPRLASFQLSPDEQYMAFTHSGEEALELWVLDIAQAKARRLLKEAHINASARGFIWLSTSKEILYSRAPQAGLQLVDADAKLPEGPVVGTSDGKKAQNRTYQDLLKNATDEENFARLMNSELHIVNLEGESRLFLKADMYSSFSNSPDGKYILCKSIERPFSYLVPYSRFPYKERVYELATGQLVKEVNSQGLAEALPKGFMSVIKGKRSMGWRSDKPASLSFVVALDEGDPAKELEFRDELFSWDAPFEKEPQSLFKTKLRYYSTSWQGDDLALVTDYWYDTRQMRLSMIAPGKAKQVPVLLEERNYQDRYNDPGDFQTEKNDYNRQVLLRRGQKLYRIGEGLSPEGQAAFLDEFDMKSRKSKRLYQVSDESKFEQISSILDIDKGELLLRIESPSDYPNYYKLNFKQKKAEPQALSQLQNPFASLDKVHKEVLRYQRADGVELSGTLYLPADYDSTSGKKLPLLIWAYPREYKDKASAGQVTANAKSFTFPYYGSFVYWVNKGYAVLDNAAFPIVGEGETEPNDNFIEQLIANAEAAINAVDARGFIDPKRVGIGGHSYGAFMTANLLTHTNLFACGIARSGAYNRTLTPFGFQSEQRNYWEAQEIYQKMSPFMHANKMKTPLLLTHGEADNNPGTFTLQTERYFQALKGFAAPVRMVILPLESHGYKAKENIFHLLWEQERFLDEHLMPQGK